MAKILLVDDDADHAQMVSAYLTRETHTIDHALTGADALHLLDLSEYDLIILDWNLPDMEGVEVLRRHRRRGATPVIMLTGKGKIADRELGLDSGADDYLVKPFSARELLARIRAVLRRTSGMGSNTLMAGGYTLDPANMTAARGSEEIRLPRREFALLEFLARHPNGIFESQALITKVWSAESEASTDTVRTAIKQIRRKLGESIIETVSGAGYRLGSGAAPPSEQ